LFVQLPPTVLHVKIGDGKPLSPAIHIGVRRWPHSYESLIKPCVDLLLQARALLDDYTKGDSWYWRVFFLHWARHHTDEVARLVMRIDNGLINNTQDLLGELALIEPRNEVRSLGRRISFLTSKSLQATVGNRPRLALDAVDEVEMITMSHPC